jgi:hypothetical protein
MGSHYDNFYIDSPVDDAVYKTEYKGVYKEADLWEPEFRDFVQVLLHSANTGKYPLKNWLNKDGRRSTFREYHDSAFHHLAKSFAGIRYDNETGLDHLLHVAANAMMLYTRLKRGIKHPNDQE